LLHGWLGSADSSYVLSAAANLLAAGYKVVRLNFRDHGDTAHLNEEMFHSARIREVVDACVQLADQPSALIGFSLGGNFALRVCSQTAMPALAICPAIDPARSCTAIDSGPSVYRNYFLRKWYRALATKSAAFPALYDFSQVQNISNVLELTDRFIGGHLPYPSSQDYFDSYRIRGEMIAGKPAKIIASKDDPVIPWESVAELETSVQVMLTEFGGHCGYVPSQWLNHQMLQFLKEQNESVRPTRA
jgi:predicted alpha/beta-fold hydrolase